MHIEVTKEMRRKIIVYSSSLVIAILVFVLISRFDGVLSIIGRLFHILFPFILGFAIAFILNQPVMTFEEKVLGKTKLPTSAKRILSEIVIFVLAIGLFVLVVSMVVPSLIDSLKTFMGNVQEYSSTLQSYLELLAKNLQISTETIEQWFSELDLLPSISVWIKNYIPKIADFSFGFVKELMNIIIAIAAAFYILLDKESLVRAVKKINYSIFSKEIANYLTLFSHDAKTVFEQYIVGNLLDSFIVGIVCYFVMLLLRFPYAPMIGFIVGVTNVIPIFGPFLGAIPVIVILLLINPWQSLIDRKSVV